MEGKFIQAFRRTILISDIFKENLLNKHGQGNESKMVVLYNPIDYEKFAIKKKPHDGKVFLYTGSLGHWNNLATYLEFFKMFKEHGENSRMVVCTNTASSKVEDVLNREEFSQIRGLVDVHYNVPGNKLPVYYAECDYGLQLMTLPDSRVGVKYVEYVAAGLIPIVNSNVKGAALLSERYGFGPVINEGDSENMVIEKVLSTKPIDVTSSGYKEFRGKTDLNGIAALLKQIYLD